MKPLLALSCLTLSLASSAVLAQSSAPVAPVEAASRVSAPGSAATAVPAPVLRWVETLDDDEQPDFSEPTTLAPRLATRFVRSLPVLRSSAPLSVPSEEDDVRLAKRLRQAYPLSEVTYRRAWSLDERLLDAFLAPAAGRYGRLERACGIRGDKPAQVLVLTARQTSEGRAAAWERDDSLPAPLGAMPASGRFVRAWRLVQQDSTAPVFAMAQKPGQSLVRLPEGLNAEHEVRARLGIALAACPEGSAADIVLARSLDALFPQGGAHTGDLLLAQVSRGELSSPGALQVPGAGQAPVLAQRVSPSGAVGVTAFVRAAGTSAATAFEAVQALLAAQGALPVRTVRTVLDLSAQGQAQYLFDSFELVLELRSDTNGEQLTVALRKL